MGRFGAPLSFVVFLMLAACSRGSKEKISERIVYQNEDTTSEQPPLTPDLLDEAQNAFLSAYTYESNPWANFFGRYSPVKEIRDQGKTGLCMAFALRDLLVNNLGLKESKAPSVYSLLSLNNYDTTKILFSMDMAFHYDHYRLLNLASKGGELLTESSEPFDAGLVQAYPNIKLGAGYKSDLYSLPSIKPKVITGYENENGTRTTLEGLLIDRPLRPDNTVAEKVTIPKFIYRSSIVNTRTLINEMKILGVRLAEGKAQIMSVCGNYIRGFSTKLFPKDHEDFEYMNNENSPSSCGRHAVLVTHVTKNEKGEPYIVFKNSWGAFLSDDGSQALPLKRFMMILGTWSDDKNESRLGSFRTEVEKVSESVNPLHQIDTMGGWRIESQVKDSLYPEGLVKISHRWRKVNIECVAKGKEPATCKGYYYWKNAKNPRKHYSYEGELKVTELMPNTFNEIIEQGEGKISLWGNVIKEGQFEEGILRKGIYREFFSDGRSPILNLVEEGDYDTDEILIKGTRKTFNRAGTLIKTETLGI